MTDNRLKLYIDGAWADPARSQRLDVIDPSTEQPFTEIALGSSIDIDRGVAAAKAAFEGFSRTSVADRIQLLEAIGAEYDKRHEEFAQAVSHEMGAPLAFARAAQVWIGRAHITEMLEVLKTYRFERMRGSTRIVKEPIGVVGMITPWNWPLNQIACKVAPALAAGCTMVLKPSEIAPLSAVIFAEVMHAAGVPKGVFNLVQGTGSDAGARLAAHPDVDMISFTGSTRAGILIAKSAADSVKRVHQELGGKSANILLPDADLSVAVPAGIATLFSNSGQTCSAPSRMFVQRERQAEAVAIARDVARAYVVGDPQSEKTNLGPISNKVQYAKIQDLIGAGLKEGATLAAGGLGRPEGLTHGYYARPTVFADVTPAMRISREEIFGPVLSILPYDSEEDAVRMANDTVYGLAAYVSSADVERARRVGNRMRAGTVYLNNAVFDIGAPFGGYKQSGNGREWAEFGLDEFLETKGVVGYQAA
jgi:aldehyde dehydrogenase (NAD+)